MLAGGQERGTDMAMMSSEAANSIRTLAHGLRRGMEPLRIAGGRMKLLSPFPPQFSGAYATYDLAVAAGRPGSKIGFDHEDLTDVAFERMCEITPWDYPVLFWLSRLLPEIDLLVDAGGHMGTKFRAFRNLLPIESEVDWVVYDVPAIVRAGRRRAELDGLDRLRFVERMEDAGAPDLFIGSGLLQYLDVPLTSLLSRLPDLPKHVILNKVALRQGPTVFTLQRFEDVTVPYQIRNDAGFMAELSRLGYQMMDRWTIPTLSHTIETHPELGASESTGFYFRRP